MIEQVQAPFRMWGYRYSMQAMVLNHEGLVIRNGEDRLVIPRAEVRRFQRELDALIEDSPLSEA